MCLIVIKFDFIKQTMSINARELLIYYGLYLYFFITDVDSENLHPTFAHGGVQTFICIDITYIYGLYSKITKYGKVGYLKML